MHREKHLRESAERHKQEHVFDFWEDLNDDEKKELLDDLSKVDFALINDLFDHCVRNKKDADFSSISPPDSFSRYPPTELHDKAKKIGETAIKKGEFGLFLPAGGQGSRLGYEGPKGCFPGTPITGKSLFQVFAEKIRSAQKKYGVSLDWYIMTSEENNSTTQEFFKKHNYFGLDKNRIFFFIQGALPSTDTEGKILMRAKHKISFNPDGTGGIYRAFNKSGIIDIMNERGVKYVFFFNVDNPLAEFVDALFLGYHIMENCNMSFKVVSKKHAHEKVGVLVKIDNKTRIIEYVNMTKEDAEKSSESGELLFKAGSINSILLSVDFIEKISKNHTLSHIAAFKKIPHINKKGEQVHPVQPNAYKFESFVFDALEYADKSIGFEVKREEEFAPIKNADGEDSPATAYALQTNLFKEWLLYAGIAKHIVDHLKKVEISPMFAFDKDDFKEKIKDDIEYYENLLKEKDEYYFD